jgi:ABC-type Mn2+/Zn2+ transport system permease subunit
MHLHLADATPGPEHYPFAATVLVACAIAAACAVLSVFVVSRRWAFIGEGISHSGFGGAGAAWLIMLAAPSLANSAWMPYAAVVLFCVATALAIGYLSHGNRVTGDAAIGIFLVASLAFGFLARQIYLHVRHVEPAAFEALLFGGDSGLITARGAVAIVCVSLALLVTVAAVGKEILAYAFDPLMAQASGVRSAAIHYLLMLLIAIAVMVGMPVIGAPLVTALIVLPGVTATQLSQRLKTVIALAVAAAVIAAVIGATFMRTRTSSSAAPAPAGH